MIWKHLDNSMLDASQWGWQFVDECLSPTMTDMPVAPDNLLKFVRCKCRKNCESRLCTCRANGLQCVTACTNCKGTDCSNATTTQSSDVVDSTSSDDEESTCIENVAFCLDDVMYDSELDWIFEEELADVVDDVHDQVNNSLLYKPGNVLVKLLLTLLCNA